MPHSTAPVLPPKPHPDFPLYVHKSNRWAKKVRSKTHFFGKATTDPKGQAALAKWLKDKDRLLAGLKPRDNNADADGCTLGSACNSFLTAKQSAVELGTLSPRTFAEYHRTTDRLIDEFGAHRLLTDIRPDEFSRLHRKLVANHGVTSLGRVITMARSVFLYAEEADLIDRRVKFGPDFKAPSKASKRKHRAKQRRENGSRVFTADEIRMLTAAAGTQFKAMILLGINGGLGNTDCATLPKSAIDLKAGWLDFPRPKTGIERRIPLWPETVEALSAVLAKPLPCKSAADANLVFRTRLGQPWVRFSIEVKREDGVSKASLIAHKDDAVAKTMRKLLDDQAIYRPGLSFYTLRRNFETIGGGCKDQVAVDAIMGHTDSSMAAEYRETIEDERLLAAVNHVRTWLYGGDVAKH